jgi:hypothetical protein
MTLIEKIANGISLSKGDIQSITSIEISASQLRINLLKCGLLQQVESAISTSDNEELKIMWEYSTVIYNYDVNVCKLAIAMNISEEELFNIFNLHENNKL